MECLTPRRATEPAVKSRSWSGGQGHRYSTASGPQVAGSHAARQHWVVIVTGAFCADSASVYEGKLFVQGGVWDHYTTEEEPPIVRCALVVLIQKEADQDETDTVVVEIFGPDGNQVSQIDIELALPAGTGQGFLCPPLALQVRDFGPHSVTTRTSSADGPSIRLDVRRATASR